MADRYITITDIDKYYGLKPFEIGNLLICVKESTDPFEKNVMRALLPYIGTVGIIANTPETTMGGTLSANKIYHLVRKRFYARVMFSSYAGIICKLESDEPDLLDNEIRKQTLENEEKLV